MQQLQNPGPQSLQILHLLGEIGTIVEISGAHQSIAIIVIVGVEFQLLHILELSPNNWNTC